MLSKKEEVESDVRKEDQQKINEFGRLNARLADLKQQISQYQSELETLDDANTELMMGEGEDVEIMIGESFFQTSEEFTTTYLESRIEEVTSKKQALEQEEVKIQSRQTILKKALYGRFGQSINLEEK